MEKYIKKIGFESIVISILLMVLGLFMVTKSTETINVIIVLLGYVFVLDGIIHLISYSYISGVYRFFSYELAEAIIDIILGFILVFNYNSIAIVLPIILGVWIILEGILQLQVALNIRGVLNSHWAIMLILSIVTAMLGIAILSNPAVSFNVMVKLEGAILMFTQLVALYEDIFVLIRIEDVDKELKKMQNDETKNNKEK